ncbi:hypothetical protein BDF22DRAFT_745115 [Syncephalis plumigaleata]|nr:hypothetical protein BDF22DRAFT_745115 [Syncephalis plumigaleata]
MPLNYNDEVLGPNWKDNATYFLGIPLHPLGEVSPFEYIRTHVDISRSDHMVLGIERRIFLITIITCLFASNLILSVQMIVQRPRILSGWFCAIAHFLGFTWGLWTSVGFAFDIMTCRLVVWYLAFGVTISSVCNSAIILQKAYLVLLRRRWVLVTGGLFVMPQLSIFVFTWWFCPIVCHIDYGCTFYYPRYLPWIWIGVEAPSQIMFSMVFSYTAYKQYKIFGTDVWRQLARDGILIMCLVILCKMTCGFIVLFDIFGPSSEMFVVVDWLVSSTVLVRHCNTMRQNSTGSADEKITNTIYISNIATVIGPHVDNDDPLSTRYICGYQQVEEQKL